MDGGVSVDNAEGSRQAGSARTPDLTLEDLVPSVSGSSDTSIGSGSRSTTSFDHSTGSAVRTSIRINKELYNKLTYTPQELASAEASALSRSEFIEL
ncbi:hypothetical protein CBOM_01078 [Ceraceosorus bombacis]|uniref:Uncharacterized protein n=1 Tax=Ceraceosorus bombacis TaxID=401625 RepID=A0A0P1BBK8_9BASI|nr:hypothetical protein CBOM_01078 [Ceraceosorus bombacis]